MTDRVKRNVEDVAYVDSDLTEIPMREVIRIRKSLIASIPRRVREEAFRARAKIIGVLSACLCGYPTQKTETDSGHSDWCPSHHLLMGYAALDEQSAERHDEDGDQDADQLAGDAPSQESQEA